MQREITLSLPQQVREKHWQGPQLTLVEDLRRSDKGDRLRFQLELCLNLRLWRYANVSPLVVKKWKNSKNSLFLFFPVWTRGYAFHGWALFRFSYPVCQIKAQCYKAMFIWFTNLYFIFLIKYLPLIFIHICKFSLKYFFKKIRKTEFQLLKNHWMLLRFLFLDIEQDMNNYFFKVLFVSLK